MGQPIRKKGFNEKVIIDVDDLDEELTLEEVHEEKLLELQLTMATTSINHEYARIEFDEANDYERREELLDYMAECRSKYLSAREELANFNPIILEKFEKDLVLQKMTTITHYNA